MFQEKYKIEFPDVDFMAKAKVDVRDFDSYRTSDLKKR